MQNAVRAARRGVALREVCRRFSVPRSTLRDRLASKAQMEPNEPARLGPKATFSVDFEEELAERVLFLSEVYYGVTKETLAELAYQFADRQGLKHRFNSSKKRAGNDWVEGFLKRNPSITLRKPERLSLARLRGVTKAKLQTFYDNLTDVMQKHGPYPPHRVWNVDETGLSPVTDCPKVLSRKGQRNVAQVTSAEKGKTTTVVGCVSASGNSVPPMMIFGGRKRRNPALTQDAPQGTIGAVSQNGWVNSELFAEWLRHFVDHAGPTQERRSLLIMDNHSSHISLDVIATARKNGVDIVSIPPHCSHVVQPLDVTVYGPLKKAWARQIKYFHDTQPGRHITDMDIGKLFSKAYNIVFRNQEIIRNGFEATGIYPYNPDRVLEDPRHFKHHAVVERCSESDESENEDAAPSCSYGVLPSDAQGPVPSTSTEGLAPSSRTEGRFRTEGATSSTSAEGPTPSTSPEGPTPSTSAEGPTPSTSAEGPTPSTSTEGPTPSTSTEGATPSSGTELLNKLLPLPKVKAKKKTSRRQITSLLVTGSPVKRRLEEQALKKKSKEDQRGKRPRKSTPAAATETDICMYCDEGVTRATESWLQCEKCGGWAHEECSNGSRKGGFLCDLRCM